jgi:late competence protein required for DNA uptake (superfamily II DNA/RNA helicase)
MSKTRRAPRSPARNGTGQRLSDGVSSCPTQHIFLEKKKHRKSLKVPRISNSVRTHRELKKKELNEFLIFRRFFNFYVYLDVTEIECADHSGRAVLGSEA